MSYKREKAVCRTCRFFSSSIPFHIVDIYKKVMTIGTACIIIGAVHRMLCIDQQRGAIPMVLYDDARWHEFLDCVPDLIGSREVLSMRAIPHHPGCSCYEHSVFVAYIAYRLARRWRLDARMAARCGLLHDLYLYNAREPGTHPGNQCFDHPVAAVRNARALCGGLSAKEENIILSHMWPLAKRRPRSREAAVVNLADKFCATLEVSQCWRFMGMRQMVTA